jgi:hypothetical protein
MGAELSIPQAAQAEQAVQTEQKPIEQEKQPQENTAAETKVIFERYIEPQGTKIEVEPTEVGTSCDVIKRKEKKKSIQ